MYRMLCALLTLNMVFTFAGTDNPKETKGLNTEIRLSKQDQVPYVQKNKVDSESEKT